MRAARDKFPRLQVIVWEPGRRVFCDVAASNKRKAAYCARDLCVFGDFLRRCGGWGKWEGRVRLESRVDDVGSFFAAPSFVAHRGGWPRLCMPVWRSRLAVLVRGHPPTIPNPAVPPATAPRGGCGASGSRIARTSLAPASTSAHGEPPRWRFPVAPNNRHRSSSLSSRRRIACATRPSNSKGRAVGLTLGCSARTPSAFQCFVAWTARAAHPWRRAKPRHFPAWGQSARHIPTGLAVASDSFFSGGGGQAQR